MSEGFDRGLEGLATGPRASDTAEGIAFDESPVAHPAVEALRARFGDAIGTHVLMSGDEHVVYVDRARSFEVLSWLKEDAAQRFDLCKDISAIDYGGNRPLELFYELWSIPHRRQLRVKVVLPLTELEVDSVYDIWRTADWLEREVYDLFGITFRNHPDLRRILMPENYAEGYPLRKDFPLRGRFSRAEQTRRALSMDVEDFYTPTELEVGGEPSSSGDGAKRQGGEPDWREAHSESDPAFGDVPTTQRAPMPGGEASSGASNP